VDEAKNANTPHDAFSLFISDDMLNIAPTHTNQKNLLLSLQLHWQGSEMDAADIIG
jgi:hypothetical protein